MFTVRHTTLHLAHMSRADQSLLRGMNADIAERERGWGDTSLNDHSFRMGYTTSSYKCETFGNLVYISEIF